MLRPAHQSASAVHFVSTLGRSVWGGSEELWSRAAIRFAKDGHRVSASVKHFPGQRQDVRRQRISASGIALTYWGRQRSYVGSRIRHYSRVLSKRCGWSWDWADDFAIGKPDLVVFSSPGNVFPASAVDVCRKRAIPYTLVVQSVSESFWPPDEQLEAWRDVYAGASAVFFVSDANRRSTELQVGFFGERFEVISNPYNVARDIPFHWPVADGTVQAAFVGRLEPEHKGLDLLFRSLADDRWKSRNLILNVYGNGRSGESVRRMAAMLGLNEQVRFHGYVQDVQSVWKQNQLLILPSRHEGLPLAVIEAMMCGRPCLVTNISGCPEHVIDGENGFIAAGPTVDAVSETLDRAWHARSQWETMGHSAYNHIRSRIVKDPVDAFVERLASLLQKPGEAE